MELFTKLHLFNHFLKLYTMAKQRGVHKLEGTLDELSYYKSKDGFVIRHKGGVSAERMATDEAFARTRENHLEFARAGRAGKVLRSAFRPVIVKNADRRMVSRLFKEMMRVVKADATNDRGQRNVLDGELALLEGFEFNDSGKLSQTLFAAYTSSIDRASGVLSIDLPSFVPQQMILAPAEATHYQIVSAGGSVDFTTGSNGITTMATEPLPLGSAVSIAVNHSYDAGANNPDPLFLVLGISFLQLVNGKNYPLNNGAYNALQLIKVSGV